jgi:phage terminase large subunit-like protein
VFLRLHEEIDTKGDVFEALYGGAAGGGKSDALLMAAAQYVAYPEYSAVCLRRTYAELAQPDALMDRAMRWWVPAGAHWNGTDKVFTFPSGARIKMGYHSHPRDDLQYQGAAYQFVGWDELTHWPDARAYEWLQTRIRRPAGSTIPLRMLSGSNPGGPGHQWVKNRFIGGVDIATGERFEPKWPFVPAKILDNPHLDREAYVRSLARLHPTLRAQLLEGDWSARDPGDYFRLEWFGPLLDPEVDHVPSRDKVSVRWWDLAASVKEDAARTAGVKMSRLRGGVRVVEHATAFRATPGDRDARIIQQAKLDGHAVVVGIEIEGGSGGPAQFEGLAARLKAAGFRCVGARPKVEQRNEKEAKLLLRNPYHERGKMGRADPVASCLERGHQRRGECPETGEPWWGADQSVGLQQQRDGLRLYAGPWTQPYLDEIEGFPEGALCDLVDATSGAWSYLEAHPFGQRAAIQTPQERKAAELHGVHPEERPEHRLEDDLGGTRHRSGRWRQ